MAEPERRQTARWIPAAVFVLALAVRLAFLSNHQRPLASDEIDYDELGWSLSRTGRYTMDGAPTAYRAPGYPALIGAVYAVAGRRPDAVKALQGVLDSITAVLLYALLRRRHRAAAAAAGFGWALFPPAILFSNLLFSEAAFVFGLVLFALLADLRGPPTLAWAAGLLLGGLILVKPSMLIVAAAVPWVLSRSPSPRTGSPSPAERGSAAVLLAVALLPVLLWLVRNVIAVGAPVLTTSTGVNLLIGNNPAATGGYMAPTLPAGLEPSGEFEADRRAGRAALAFISEHPVTAMRTEAKKLALLAGSESELAGGVFSPGPSRDRLRDRIRAVPGWLRFLVSFPTAAVVLLGLFGFATRPLDDVGRWFIAVALATVIATAVFFGSSRFHFPLMPFLVLFGAEFASSPQARIRFAPRARLIGAAGVCGVVAAAWVAEAWLLSGT